jgi:hypothetical protein
MSGFIVQIPGSHDPLKPSAWLAESDDTTLRVVYDRNLARVFDSVAEAPTVAFRYRDANRLQADVLGRQKRRAA